LKYLRFTFTLTEIIVQRL